MAKKLTFSQNILTVFSVVNGAENGDSPKQVIKPKVTLRCDYGTLGMQRKFAAQQAQLDVSDVVYVPLFRGISTQDVVRFKGSDEQYDIVLVQHVTDSYPFFSKLTLSRRVKKYDSI